MFDSLLTLDELEANTRRLALDKRVSLTALGVSRTGRPIEMISLGDGDRDALIVGVPHPNEPAGAVTIERMISLLLDDESQRRGYRWHFIKAIDPEGLRLNQGWLKSRTLTDYLENFFRPALNRQPETTFPLDIPEAHFDACMPENHAWQRAFELTRPSLHATLHHCDFGGVFYSLSRALPEALAGLEAIAENAKVGINDLDDGVMDAEQWTPAVKRYPSVPELIVKAKASGAAWAYPWTVGEMSPGFGEANYGTFTLIAEVPMWDTPALHDRSPSDFSVAEQQIELRAIAAKARERAARHIKALATEAMTPDENECLWALQLGLKMMPASQAQTPAACVSESRRLSRHDFEMMHTQQVLYVLRTYAMILSLAKLIQARQPDHPAALAALQEVQRYLRNEISAVEARTPFLPVPVSVMTEFQMQSIFTCADALRQH